MSKDFRISSHLVLLIISILVVILLIVFSIITAIRLNTVTKDLEVEKINLMQNEVMLKELRTLKQAKVGMELIVSVLETQIPDEPDEYKVIDDLRLLCLDNGATLKSVRFNDRINTTDIVEMPLELSFTGKYPAIVSLMKAIDNGERLIRIDSISISKPNLENSIVEANIKASAFYK